MNNQSIDPQSPLNLPTPHSQTSPSAPDENTSLAASGLVASPQPQADGTLPAGQQVDSSAATPQSMPPIADDIDLIEKEWVYKAKEIVENTQGDPYIRTKEMTKVKADYLKKRYNKDLKIEEN